MKKKNVDTIIVQLILATKRIPSMKEAPKRRKFSLNINPIYRRKEPAFTDERDKFKRVYNFADDQYRYADEGQDLESREEEKMDKAKFDRLARKNQGYYVKRHLDPDSNVEQEEIVEIRDLTVKSRDTQTPTRKVVDEGIQHDKQAASLAKSKFGSGRLGQRESEDAKSIHVEHEHERVPISTVKK